MECSDRVTPQEEGNLFSLMTHSFPGIFHSVTVVRPHVRQRLIKGHWRRKIQTFPVCRQCYTWPSPSWNLPWCYTVISGSLWDIKPRSLVQHFVSTPLWFIPLYRFCPEHDWFNPECYFKATVRKKSLGILVSYFIFTEGLICLTPCPQLLWQHEPGPAETILWASGL